MVIPTVSGGSGWPRPERGVVEDSVWAEKEKLFIGKVIYHPPEGNSMMYCYLGVFRKEYFRLFSE